MTPMKCPSCPERNYYGRLVDAEREPNPKCDNCKHALVVPASFRVARVEWAAHRLAEDHPDA